MESSTLGRSVRDYPRLAASYPIRAIPMPRKGAMLQSAITLRSDLGEALAWRHLLWYRHCLKDPGGDFLRHSNAFHPPKPRRARHCKCNPQCPPPPLRLFIGNGQITA
jgi:hypothetical protein